MRLEKLFLKVSILFTVYLSSILFLAVFGYFAKLPVVVLTVLFLVVCLYFAIDIIKRAEKGRINSIAIVSFVIIAVFCFVIGYFHHDLPTGRDDFSYIYAADRLSVSGSLEWNDYFTRPVHGVRNLGGDTFTSQFLPSYTTYLAVYNLFGGLEALMWANVLLFLLTLGVFYFLIKNLAGRKASLIGIILMLSSYVFFWFPKRTNSENISMFLIWLGIWLMILALKNKKTGYLLLGLIPYSLLLLTRPEGVIFFAVYCTVTLFLIFSKYNNMIFRDRLTNIAGLFSTIFNLIIFYFYISRYEANYILTQAIDVFEGFDFVYKNISILLLFILMLVVLIASAIKLRKKIDFQRLIFWTTIVLIVIFEAVFLYSVSVGDLKWIVYRTQYVLENFVFYFYFLYIFIILLGLKKKVFTQNEFLMTVILLPAFFFIIEPNIALDQPWFMRRFFPTLIPLFIILSAVALSRLSLTGRKLKYVVFSLVLIGIVTTRSIFFFVENDGILSQVESFNKIFPKESLVVMNPGWDWQKIAVIQHYFYDIDALPNIDLYRVEEFKKDLPELLSQYPNWEQSDADLISIMNWDDDRAEQEFIQLLGNYKEVYIVTDEPNSNFFKGFRDDNLEYVDTYTFKYDELNMESNLTGYIQQTEIIDIKKVRSMQNNIPPNTINSIETELYVYKVKDIKSYIPLQYVFEITDGLDKGYNYIVLKPADLAAYKKELQSVVRNIGLGLD
ncbi:MAG: glycosyltransferase family 39 protein [Patescibacteria group bacterium]